MGKIIAFTGAGVSADSGIPTFNDLPGIRNKLTRSFAVMHPKEYQEVLEQFGKYINEAKPNAAHIALAEYDIPIITMNIDMLHQRAGSKDVIAVHGDFPDIVLYEDPAPKYQTAFNKIMEYQPGDILLVIGASRYTDFSSRIINLAKDLELDVVEIQDSAAIKVREFLEGV